MFNYNKFDSYLKDDFVEEFKAVAEAINRAQIGEGDYSQERLTEWLEQFILNFYSLGNNLHVGRGYIYNPNFKPNSKQGHTDVIIYKGKAKIKRRTFVVVEPNDVLIIIEVKSTVDSVDKQTIEKAGEEIQFRLGKAPDALAYLFCLAGQQTKLDEFTKHLQEIDSDRLPNVAILCDRPECWHIFRINKTSKEITNVKSGDFIAENLLKATAEEMNLPEDSRQALSDAAEKGGFFYSELRKEAIEAFLESLTSFAGCLEKDLNDLILP